MSTSVTRRAFIAGIVGAAVAGWALLRDRGPVGDQSGGTTTVPGGAGQSTTIPSAGSSVTQATVAAPATTATTITLAPAVTIEALCRDAWGAAQPTADFTEHTVERLTVHHTARLLEDNRDAPGAIRGHQVFHQGDRGWADIAYHFMIDLEGNVYECRPVTAVGDTATTYDPTGHFLVCCEGDFNAQELPAAQEGALINVLAWAAGEFDVAPSTIRGHRDLATTTCPGDNLYPLIESGSLTGAVDALLAAGGAKLVVVCGAVADDRVAAIEA